MWIIDRLKRGFITIEVKVYNPEKFINFLWYKGIRVKNIQRVDISTLIMEIPYSDYKYISSIAKRSEAKVRVVSKEGLAFLLMRIRTRLSLVVGVIMFVTLLYFLSMFIWAIEIDTNRYIPPFEIRKQLKTLGIVPGIKKSKLNVYDLEKKIEDVNGEVMWVRARIEGSTLKIKIEEKVNPPKDIVQSNNNDVVAKMDGEIVRIYTTAGTAQVKGGDVVKKGQVLIKGVEGKEGFEYSTAAEGKVLANTFYERMMELQVSGKTITRTGEKQEEMYFEILGKKIYIKKAIKKFKDYDKIEEKGNLLNKIVYYEKNSKDIIEDREKIINDSVEKLYNSTMESLDKQAKFVDKVVNVEELGEGKIRLKIVFIIQQDIAIKMENKN